MKWVENIDDSNIQTQFNKLTIDQLTQFLNNLTRYKDASDDTKRKILEKILE